MLIFLVFLAIKPEKHLKLLNENREFCYRIIHIDNLQLLLQNGIVTKYHAAASHEYVEIGNPSIIAGRDNLEIKIEGYGKLGEYVPFYFTPRSPMLYNIITGQKHPKVKKRERSEIIVIRCLISELVKQPYWFFTNGNAFDGLSNHYNELKYLEQIDWISINKSLFKNDEEDYNRMHKYQAEFLVRENVPLNCIESLNVFDRNTHDVLKNILTENNINLAVNIQPQYFF